MPDPSPDAVDLEGLLLIVVGAHLRAEQGDRPLAYELVRRIERWKTEHDGVLGIELEPIVCTDLLWLNVEAMRQRPTICIGGPGVNAVSKYFESRLPDEVQQGDGEPRVLLQIDEDFTDLRVCVWGTDEPLTAKGLDIFCERYLDAYLRAVATQVEPHDE